MASASYGGAYVPPYATKTTTATAAAGTSISFAQIATPSAGSSGGGGTATMTAPITDSTGGVNANSLLDYFTKPYIDAHTLSLPTWRYTYILWFAILGTLIVWSIAYNLSGTGTGGSALGAWFRKWSIRRITWTKRVGAKGGKAEEGHSPGTTGTRRKVIFASPTVAQMIAVGVLILVALLCSFVGDDYIAVRVYFLFLRFFLCPHKLSMLTDGRTTRAADDVYFRRLLRLPVRFGLIG